MLYETELENIREKIYAFCFPNIPATLEQQEAFERAAAQQYAFEQEQQRAAADLPYGVKSFRLGDLSAELDLPGYEEKLTQKSISPVAYSLLLRSGLLYRGAEGKRT